MNLIDREFIKYMSRFDDCPYTLVLHGEKHQIGKGEPVFSVAFGQVPKVGELLTSTSIALGGSIYGWKYSDRGGALSGSSVFSGPDGEIFDRYESFEKADVFSLI